MQAIRGYVKVLRGHVTRAGLVLAALILIPGTGVALAAEAPATGPELPAAATSANGPDTALSAPSGWVSTVQGTRTWYAFQYAGDKSQISIQMQVYPSSAASFTVWTPQNAQGWRQGQTVTPVGAGSPGTVTSGSNPLECRPVAGSSLLQCPPAPTNNLNELVWSGNFNSPGIYYVVVAQSGPPGGYNLTVTGTGVVTAGTAPPAAATATQAPQATGTPAPALGTAAPATGTVPSGNGPDTALSAPSGWVSTAQGANTWYAFQYAGDKSQNPDRPAGVAGQCGKLHGVDAAERAGLAPGPDRDPGRRRQPQSAQRLESVAMPAGPRLLAIAMPHQLAQPK